MQIDLLPIIDVGPNDGTAAPSGPHCLNLDDEPNDGDTTYVALASAGFREVFQIDVSRIPAGAAIISLTIRWAAKKGQFAAVGAVGVRVNDVYYMAPTRSLPGVYQTFSDLIAYPLGGAWTKDSIAGAFAVLELSDIDSEGGSTVPHFSEIIYRLQVIPGPGHPHAGGTSQAPRAAGLSQSRGIRGSGQAPRAGLSNQAAVAVPASRSPRTAASCQAPATSVSGRTPRAVTSADLPTLRVSFASQAPRAAVSGSSPQATVSPKAPKAEGS